MSKKFKEEEQYAAYYKIQNEYREKVILKDHLSESIQYIAGVDVAYAEDKNRMVGAIVVLNANTFEIVEEASHEMKISFPYVPGLFSFREMPSLIQAYKKLNIKPELIICDGHGIAHPKNVGMATHLGIELDIPTIGCGKTFLIGEYDHSKLGLKKGDRIDLLHNGKIVGVALRSQDNVKPIFVSIGHKVSLATAIEWALKLTPNFRLPETTRLADQLVNRKIKEI